MKLLIVTQKVDKNDDILGFFHRWIEEFAKHCESIVVICLFKGEYNLPKNVRVLSLGKEEVGSRIRKTIRYVVRFYKYIWSERKNYDSVFVHMNQEYVLLGAPIWKVFKKKVTMWRNHHFGNIFTRLAMVSCDRIFCTSKYSFTASSPKTVIMPVGIDTDFFKKDPSIKKQRNSILFLARISPVKKPELLIEVLHLLNEKGVVFTAGFYGDALPHDYQYLELLKKKVREYRLEKHILFFRGVPNYHTPTVYNQYEIFVNTTTSGSFDKTIFEAMACELSVLTSNYNLKGELSETFIFKEDNVEDLSRKLEYLLSLDPAIREKNGKELREYVASRHTLKILAGKLMRYF